MKRGPSIRQSNKKVNFGENRSEPANPLDRLETQPFREYETNYDKMLPDKLTLYTSLQPESRLVLAKMSNDGEINNFSIRNQQYERYLAVNNDMCGPQRIIYE